MLYSANAFENIYYFVGTAVAEIKENLSEMVWKKYPNDYTWMPLLKKNEVVEGTGHNTVAKAPNLFEDWIVYHGRDIEEGLHRGQEQRNMRIDPLLCFGDRMFCPGPSYVERPAPGKGFYSDRDMEASENVFFAEVAEFYRMEIWCSAANSHAGAKYMLYPDYGDEKNYIGLRMHSGTGKISAVWRNGGIAMDIAEMSLSEGYDFSVPHLIHVERRKHDFTVTLDEDRKLEFRAETAWKNGRIGAGGCFTPMTIHSAVVAQGAELRGKDLFLLSEFYDCFGGEMKDGMLRGRGDILRLAEKGAGKIRMQSFQWQVCRAKHRADLYCGEEKLCSLTASGDMMTFYCCRENDPGNESGDDMGDGCLYILTDGKVEDKGSMNMTEVSGIAVLSGKSGIYDGSNRGNRERALRLETVGLGLLEYTRM